MIIQKLFLVIGLFFLVGCGAQSKPSTAVDGDNSESIAIVETSEPNITTPPSTPNIEEERVEVVFSKTLPQTISMEIPQILKKSSFNETNQSFTTEESIAYTQLIDDLERSQKYIALSKINLIYLENVMPEVLERCEGMTQCTFEEEELSFIMNEQVINLLKESNLTVTEDNDTEIYFGEIEFTKNAYHYRLSHHQRDTVQTVKWSEESEDVETLYVKDGNNSKESMSLKYLTQENGQRVMHLFNTTQDKRLDAQKNLSFTLMDTNDINRSIFVTANTVGTLLINRQITQSNFSLNGKVSDEGSQLLFVGGISDESFKEKIVLDTENNITTVSYFDSNESDEFNGDNFFDSTKPATLEFYELNIEGGVLENGEYRLVAPNTNVESLDLMDMFELSVGTFTKFDGKIQGALYDNSYIDVLNKLTVVAITESQEVINMFEIVELEDKPNITAIK
ncbi:MAG TPA: hypothetical protein EYG90_00515 [Campylobacterales bacterium]|nr:hypothetical protein [Campylobacterales bacterium]